MHDLPAGAWARSTFLCMYMGGNETSHDLLHMVYTPIKFLVANEL